MLGGNMVCQPVHSNEIKYFFNLLQNEFILKLPYSGSLNRNLPSSPFLRRQQDNSSIKKYIRMLGCISFNDKQGRNNYAKRIPCRLQCTLLSIVLNIHTLTHIRKFSSVVSNWYAVKLPPNPHSLIYNG